MLGLYKETCNQDNRQRKCELEAEKSIMQGHVLSMSPASFALGPVAIYIVHFYANLC